MIFRCHILLGLLFLSDFVAAQTTILQKYASYYPANNSVLNAGYWYKIKLKTAGIYRLTYEDLVSIGISDPSKVKVYGNGSAMVPMMNNMPRYDDLIENAVYMHKGTDGLFNQGDYILFYGQGNTSWSYNPATAMFEHQLHLYSEASYYFITSGDGGLKISARDAIAGTPTADVTTFDDYAFREKEIFNFIKSGRQWFGDRIDNTPFDSVFTFPNLVTSEPVKIKVNAASRSDVRKAFTLYHNNTYVDTFITEKVILNDNEGYYARQKSKRVNINAAGDQVPLRLSYNKSKSTDQAYLDYIILNAKRKLTRDKDYMFFRDQSRAGTNELVQYTVENCDEQTEIWEITDPFNIKKITATLSGNELIFNDSTNLLREYVVLKPGSTFPKPEIENNGDDVGPVNNQNLHAIGPHQMLVITHPLFRDAADSIAEFHRQKDNLSVAVVDVNHIYNEFSSGTRDVSSIRDFVRMVYDRATGDYDRLKYVLLAGDGSYNNISRIKGNANFIPTYQSWNSLYAIRSYVTDDFFGMLGVDEGGSESMDKYNLEIGLGRLPVKTPEEALILYNKIKNYNKPQNKGDWQNNILFAGDDENGNIHMRQANELATWMDNNFPQFMVKKVFLDAYPQASTSIGARYPDVNRILKENFKKGLLIFNYTGHGGEKGLADEAILMSNDIASLDNKILPLFITATCEFSRFDDLTRSDDGTIIESTSAGELSILNPNGGSIGLITTTRVVFSTENHDLNMRFYQTAFNRDAQGNLRSLGEALMLAKNSQSGRNKLNFILLGDPALKLAIPNYKVVTDSINNVVSYGPIDTLKAFTRVTISGHIEDNNGQLINDFSGILYPSVYDKSKTVTTLANDSYTVPMQFSTREDILYKGKVSVANGRFRFEFIVPKDITYSYGNGRISYFSNNNLIDANGHFSSFIIGGTNYISEQDNNGPDISLWLNDEYFNNQGITNSSPVIFARINDESGINTVGNGIGHDITGVIDGDVANPVIMNEFFTADLNNASAGELKYPMQNLSEGVHTLTIKVWDIYNNSSEATIEFRVIPENRMIISKAGNYPNPAREYTHFHFEHNQAEDELDVSVVVYDMEGRIVLMFTETVSASGYNTTLPAWDLRDMNGNMLNQGIYPYRIRLTNSQGLYADSYHKLVIVR